MMMRFRQAQADQHWCRLHATEDTSNSRIPRDQQRVHSKRSSERKQNRKLAVLGGSFEIDRVIQSTSGQAAEASFQMEQKIKGVKRIPQR